MRDVEVKAIIRMDRLDTVIRALRQLPDLPGVTVSHVQGFGRRRTAASDVTVEYGETLMVKLETVVPAENAETVVQTIRRTARTGRPGDGKMFVLAVEQTIRIRDDDDGSVPIG